MKFSLCLVIGLVLCLTQIESHPRYNDQNSENKVLTEYSDDVQNYLKQFGYLDDEFRKSSNDFPSQLIETGNLRSEEQLKSAIRRLQEYAGIPQTGYVDDKTRMLFKSPRCGVPDFDSNDFTNRNHRRRFKRFVVHDGMKWSHLKLTWSLVNQTMTSFDVNRVRRIFHEALNVWSKHSNLNFTEVGGDADIQIMFARQRHGDGYDFDGPGNVLAHAFYPGTQRGGDAHFDEEERWHLDDRTIESHGTSLKNVAVHEFGHSLGLGHSSVQGAVMFPWYHGYRGDGDLPEDDRLAIQSLYGVRDGARQWGPNPRRHHYTQPTTKATTTTTTRRPYYHYSNRRDEVTRRTQNTRSTFKPRYFPHETTTSKTPYSTYRPYHRHNNPKPDTCNTAYDAITIIRGEVFIFKNRFLWRIGSNGLMPGYPHEITKMWRELPRDLTHVDTVYENKKRQIVFFIGKEYYIFSSQHLLSDYPKPLTSLGLPEHIKKIDAALVWGYNNRTYFYSGSQYWRFDEDEMQVELDYPRDIKSIWKGVPNDLDSAFQYKDGKSYFFEGKKYWEFDDMQMRVTQKMPKRSSLRWMGCKPRKVALDQSQDVYRNSKLKDEFDDIDTDIYDDDDFDFEAFSETSSSSQVRALILNFAFILLPYFMLI